MERNNTKKKKTLMMGAAFLIGVVAVLVSVSYGQELRRRVELQKHVSNLRSEINENNEKIADLRKFLEYLKTDAYIERAAHEKLGFMSPGEHAVVVPNGGMVAGAQFVKTQKESGRVSVPKQWWNLFFGDGLR